jgi:hypothetical protein
VTHRVKFDHFFGVGLFVAGSALYSISLLHFAAIFELEKRLALVRWCLQLFLIISSFGLMLAFVILWMLEEGIGKHGEQVGDQGDDTQIAYLVEHIAYISHLLFYVIFFLFHTPNPLREVGLTVVYEAEHASDPNSVAMKPLLRPSGPGRA